MKPGTRLGPYEIVSPLGAGGMGEVYRARDTRLERTVAVKVLPEPFAGDLQRRERFQREARAISSLNHPHICALHDVGVQDDTAYLVMEYVEGESLAERLKRGRMEPAEALPLARQIAGALDAAHRHGIVHRDLKPANIMLGPGGVKLLDFGLARMQQAPAAEALSSLPTEGTQPGAVLGTPPYMAPEQLEGREADARSDIFAFGCVLYEMLAGKRAFTGESPASLIAAILGSQPATIREAQPSASPAIEQLIRICLAKKPDDRWQSARDLLHALDWSPEPSQTEAAQRPRFDRLAWIVGAAGLLVAGIALAIALNRPAAPTPQQVRFTIAPPAGTEFTGTMMLSPDGNQLLFVARSPEGRQSLWIRALHSVTPQPVPSAEGLSSAFWSPDGRSVGFTVKGSLKRLELATGAVTTLCNACSANFGAWGRDGTILFDFLGSAGPIRRLPAQGGTPREATRLDSARGEKAHWFPRFAPDHRHFVYTIYPTYSAAVGSLDGTAAGSILPIKADPVIPSAAGWILFPQGGALMAQRCDIGGGKLTGEPLLVAEPAGVLPGTQYYPFTAADNGTLAWLSGPNIEQTRLTWYSASGVRQGTLGDPGEYSNPALSPDGKKLLAGLMNPTTRRRALILIDNESGLFRPVTDNSADNLNPAWSPDGSRFAWTADTKGARDIYVRAWNDDQAADPLLVSPLSKALEQWTPDGRYLIFNEMNQTERTIWALPMMSGVSTAPIRLTPGLDMETMGRVSPDGKFLAFAIRPSDAPRVVVKRFPPSDDLWQLVVAPGLEPQWSPDGKQLYWISGETIMVAPVSVSGTHLTLGQHQTVLKVRLPAFRRNRFLIAPDGRLLVNALADQEQKAMIAVMTHWDAVLPR